MPTNTVPHNYNTRRQLQLSGRCGPVSYTHLDVYKRQVVANTVVVPVVAVVPTAVAANTVVVPVVAVVAIAVGICRKIQVYYFL